MKFKEHKPTALDILSQSLTGYEDIFKITDLIKANNIGSASNHKFLFGANNMDSRLEKDIFRLSSGRNLMEISKILAQPSLKATGIFNLPPNIKETLFNINVHQTQLSKDLHFLKMGLVSQASLSTAIRNFNLAITSNTEEVVFQSLRTSNPAPLLQLDEILQMAAQSFEKVVSSANETTTILKDFEQKIDAIYKLATNGNSKIQESILKLLTVLSFLYSILTEYRIQKNSDNGFDKITFKEIVRNEIIDDKINRGYFRFSLLRKNSVVYSSAISNSSKIDNLPENYNVTVLKVYKKWSLIAYSSPKNGLQCTGWVFKKNVDAK